MRCLTTQWLVVVAMCAACATAFNVDLDTFVRHRGEPGSMFGFSIAQYKDRSQNWLVVGAPEAQTRQPGVVRGGAVYRCDLARDDACQPIDFDVSGNNNNSAGAQIDRKSEQWFGATVQTSVVNGVIVACAPRYVSFHSRVERRDPVGTCWVAKNGFTDMAEYSPCRTRNWGHHRQGSCQAGLGAAVSEDGERLFVGAVGSWYWQGQLFDISSDARLPYYPPNYQEYGAGQLYSQSLTARQSVLATREGPAADDDSYLGYSVTAGDFDGSGRPGVAVGMPRGADLVGKIVLYSWNLTNSRNITGDQIGGYFGYSICTSDVDGDGLPDLVIGAPLYTDPDNNEGHYENGRVYIVYQGIEDKFSVLHTRDGVNSKARFGLSVATLGDINRDGYGDFVVGAPYDGTRGRGAVYIYHGSKIGCQEKPSQVIHAEDVGFELSTFGFSVAGGHDLDNNQYPDLAVGAYASETAIFLKSRPVVRMSASLVFGAASKLISLKEKNCTTRDGTPVPCIALTACFTYSGLGVDRRLEFVIQFLLDTKKTKDVRMFFLEDEGRSIKNHTVRLDHNTRFCKSQTVYIKSNLRDKLTPLEAEVRYSLNGGAYGRATARNQRSLAPVLDQAGAATQKDSIHIEKNCGKDNVCIPDLKLVVNPSVEQYLLGSGDRFTLDVVVENFGEDSFESTFNLRLPDGMNYNKIERVDDFEREIPVQCSAPSPATNNTLKCDIGNPLPRRKLVHFKVLLTPYHRDGMKSRYEFAMEVNSTNPEAKGANADNLVQLSVPIWVQTDHVASGYSYPSTEIAYNMSAYRDVVNVTTESEAGPQVVHVYSVKNQGPSDIVEAEAFFVWPSTTRDDEPLLYLLEPPQTEGNIVCAPAPDVNPLGLALESLGRKTALEFHGLVPAGGSASQRGSGRVQVNQGGRIMTEEELRVERQKGTSRSGSTWSTSSSSSSSSSSGGSTYHQSGGSSSRNASAERAVQEEILKAGGRIYAVGARSRVDEGSSIHVEPGSYQGGGHSRGGGLAVLEHDYNTFGGQAAAGHATRTQTGSQSTRTHQSGTTHTRTQTGDNGDISHSGGRQNGRVSDNVDISQSGGRQNGRVSDNVDISQSGGRQNGRVSDNVDISQSGGRQNGRVSDNVDISQSGGRQNGRVSDNVDISQSGGRQNERVSGTRTYSSSSETGTGGRGGGGWDYDAAGRATQGGGSRTTYSSSAESSGESRGSAAGDYGGRGGASRTHQSGGGATSYQGGRTHTFDGDLARGGGGGGERTFHESRNFSATFTENDGLPRTYSNYSFANSTGAGNVSGGWQSGDSLGLGRAGAGSRARDYGGTARQSNLEQSSSSGYNVGNPRSEERHLVPGDGLAVYNWTDRVDSFGNNDGSTRVRVTGRPRNQEPGFENSEELRQREVDALFALAAKRQRDHAKEERVRADEHWMDLERQWQERERSRQEAEVRLRSQQRSNSRSETRTSSSSSTSGTKSSRERDGGVSSEDVDSRFQLYGRFERSVSELTNLNNKLAEDTLFSNRKRSSETEARWERPLGDEESGGASAARQESDAELARTLDCAASKCSTFKCVVGPLKKDEEAFVGLRFRAWARTLDKVAWNRPVELSSLVAARVTKLPHVGEPFEMKLKTAEVKFNVFPAEVPVRPDIVPLWVVVLSACAGAIILLLLVFLLYKCGFFKRTRPTDTSAEKQPLNRNGHFNSGDEAL